MSVLLLRKRPRWAKLGSKILNGKYLDVPGCPTPFQVADISSKKSDYQHDWNRGILDSGLQSNQRSLDKISKGSWNEGLYVEKSCVRFQTDGIVVSWTATVPAWLTYKWSRAFPGCVKSDSSVSCCPLFLQMEGQHRGIRTSPQSRGSRKEWWRNGDGKWGEWSDW
jgi:hypothetical protein